MAQVNVRNLDDWIVAALREQAQANGRSLETELRETLRTEALRGRWAMADELRALSERMASTHGPMADTTVVIRDMRDAE